MSASPSTTDRTFDLRVDVLVVGSGGGGMTAALAADAAGLDTLVVEKSARFGGSTALSGGGIWVPGAPSQRRAGHVPDPDEVFTVPARDHRRAGQRRPAAQVRRHRPRDDGVPGEPQPLAGVRVETRLRRLLPRGARRLRARQHHQRRRDRSARTGRRGAEPADAVGAGAQGHLVRAERPAAVLPGPAVLARKGGAGEIDLAHGPGAVVRRTDGRHRAVAVRPATAGDEAAATSRCGSVRR